MFSINTAQNIITLFFESNMLTSQGILRNHYSLVFPAQLMSDRTKYKCKPSGKFKEKKERESSLMTHKVDPKQRKGTTKRGFKRNAQFLLQRKASERSVCETGHKATVKRTPVAQARVTSKRSPPRGVTPRKIWWECAARFPKPLPYL